MTEEFKHLSQEEKLKAENDFMKMKIMIEHGGHFCSGDAGEELPPEIENVFLSNIIEFEKQFAERKTTTVFEKVGKPEHFKPVSEIPDHEIEPAWENLSEHLNKFGVELSVCSPRVTIRELYRFTLEELFKCEVDDINIPGLTSCFTYDEFHPDHEYDNSRSAREYCILALFNKQPFEWMYNFSESIRLNDHFPLTKDEFAARVNRFKECYDEIVAADAVAASSIVTDKTCVVKGNYSAMGRFGNQTAEWAGQWLVEFAFDDQLEYWCITNVQVGGVNF